jgi:hypothetical protein
LDRYYKPEEWWKLRQEKRARIITIRKKKRKVPEVDLSDSEGSDDEKKPTATGTTQRNDKAARNT